MFKALQIATAALVALIGGYCIGKAQQNTVTVFVTKTPQLPPALQDICDEVDDEDEGGSANDDEEEEL